MGFLRAEITYENTKFVARMYHSWLYLGEQMTEESFDSLEEAQEWILHERCYNKLDITEEARNALSYRDALRLQLNKKEFQNRKNKNRRN